MDVVSIFATLALRRKGQEDSHEFKVILELLKRDSVLNKQTNKQSANIPSPQTLCLDKQCTVEHPFLIDG